MLTPPSAFPGGTTRRALVAGGLTLATGLARAAPLPVPPSRQMMFQVSRNGSVIGTHRFAFESDANTLLVTITVEMAVGLGPIAFYRYRHNAVERWSSGSFASIEARTDDNGARHVVTAIAGAKGVALTWDATPPRIVPTGALPATHWNRQMLTGPLINTQTGEVMQPIITSLGIERIVNAAGAPIDAEHLTLRGEPNIDTWYDASPGWAGLRAKVKDGSDILYRRV